jgi:hypothetical protein
LFGPSYNDRSAVIQNCAGLEGKKLDEGRRISKFPRSGLHKTRLFFRHGGARVSPRTLSAILFRHFKQIQGNLILKQFYLNCLAHASYLIGDEETGTAAVVDPRRDIERYLEFAAEHKLQIKHVILTHLHADFVAGHLELRDRVGETIYFGPRCIPASKTNVETARQVRRNPSFTLSHITLRRLDSHRNRMLILKLSLRRAACPRL